MRNPEYIGDGVYVHLTSERDVVITTGHHDPNKADANIVMEPEVLSAFLRWVETRKKEAGVGQVS